MFRVFIVIFFSCLQVYAQVPGDFVSNFGDNGKVVVNFGDLDFCEDVIVDSSDNLYFAGHPHFLVRPTILILFWGS